MRKDGRDIPNTSHAPAKHGSTALYNGGSRSPEPAPQMNEGPDTMQLNPHFKE
jgi:hypothetical protein